jgi:hypothetical protein
MARISRLPSPRGDPASRSLAQQVMARGEVLPGVVVPVGAADGVAARERPVVAVRGSAESVVEQDPAEDLQWTARGSPSPLARSDGPTPLGEPWHLVDGATEEADGQEDQEAAHGWRDW